MRTVQYLEAVLTGRSDTGLLYAWCWLLLFVRLLLFLWRCLFPNQNISTVSTSTILETDLARKPEGLVLAKTHGDMATVVQDTPAETVQVSTATMAPNSKMAINRRMATIGQEKFTVKSDSMKSVRGFISL